ncbi:hypothetical protein F7734_00950 [Scytonema sp. UIC 10036]|nr:hypothetical protein [Scytonema sp. UIC 10036]MUG91142.1 hypothetical protein [Scytonema sp. UIC 10036]
MHSILNQAKLIASSILENNLTVKALFQQSGILKLLSSQAAISIEMPYLQ